MRFRVRGYELQGREFESLRVCEQIERLQPSIVTPSIPFRRANRLRIDGCVATDGSVILLVRERML